MKLVDLNDRDRESACRTVTLVLHEKPTEPAWISVDNRGDVFGRAYVHELSFGGSAHLDHGDTRYVIRVEAYPLCAACRRPEDAGGHELCWDGSGFTPTWTERQ